MDHAAVLPHPLLCGSVWVCKCECVCLEMWVCVYVWVPVRAVYGEFLCFLRFWRALFVTSRVEPLITALLQTMLRSGHIYGRASLRNRCSPSFSHSLSFPVCLCSLLRSQILFSLVDTQSISATTIVSEWRNVKDEQRKAGVLCAGCLTLHSMMSI